MKNLTLKLFEVTHQSRVSGNSNFLNLRKQFPWNEFVKKCRERIDHVFTKGKKISLQCQYLGDLSALENDYESSLPRFSIMMAFSRGIENVLCTLTPDPQLGTVSCENVTRKVSTGMKIWFDDYKSRTLLWKIHFLCFILFFFFPEGEIMRRYGGEFVKILLMN